MNKHILPDVPVGNTVGVIQAEEQHAAATTWIVKRDAASKPRHEPRTDHAKEQLRQREWGGEEAVRRYCTAAAAKILLKRLGPDLVAFLTVANHADLGQVMAHLHAAARAEPGSGTAVRSGCKPVDEPPLPFVN